jgi:hypothetical protein
MKRKLWPIRDIREDRKQRASHTKKPFQRSWYCIGIGKPSTEKDG